jgi:tetratricopeptide (TPR) repeat protein
MKHIPVMLVIGMLAIQAARPEAKPVGEYIQEAAKQNQDGFLRQSIETLEAAVAEHPQSPEVHSYLGYYLGSLAGRTEDMMEALSLVNRAFEELDRAIAIDPQSLLARFHRGLMGISVPEFFGQLEQGIGDLELFIDLSREGPDRVPRDQLLSAYDLLARGYRARGDLDQARWAYEQIISLAPGTEMAEQAQVNRDDLAQEERTETVQRSAEEEENATIRKIQENIQRDPQDPALFVELGQACLQIRSYEKAREAFQKALDLDGTSISAYKGLAQGITEDVAQGYDQRIYDNTNVRTNLAFNLVKVLDRAVSAVPDDVELRLWRGIADVQMPFFVQKLDQGIADLELVVKSDVSDSLKAEALFWLGRAYRKKGNTAWIQVVKEHAGSPAAKMVFEEMSSDLERIQVSDLRRPLVTIDFVLGFQDELEPQTAVWIEDANGQFVKTIYVSGFAGHVKERQITLPVWGQVSGFADADAVTGASIDVGHHVFVWDLKDAVGTKVPHGTYAVKVEASYWPSMQYQLAEAIIQIGKKGHQTLVEEGNFIPYLKITCYP